MWGLMAKVNIKLAYQKVTIHQNYCWLMGMLLNGPLDTTLFELQSTQIFMMKSNTEVLFMYLYSFNTSNQCM